MLREERERQGLSIEAVSDKIKITRSCLTAIEEGNKSNLPHPVYAKGFIKNYAKLLGVDLDDFSKRLAEVYQPEEPELNNTPILHNIPEDDCDCIVRSSPKFPVGPILVVVLVVCVVAGLGWYLYGHVLHKSGVEPEAPAPQAAVEPAPKAAPPQPAPEPERPVPTVPAAKTAEPAEPATPPAAPQTQAEATTLPPPPAAQPAAPAPTPEDQATQDIATSGPAAGDAHASIPPAPAPEPAPPAPGAPAAPTLSVGEAGPHTVVITANDRCWIQAGADGGAMREAMLTKGDTFEGRFADYLLVRLGNAGAVEIRFDNKLYPLQATKGSVKTLKFVAKKTESEAAKTPASTETTPPAAQVPAAAPATPAAASSGDTAATAKEVEIYGQDGSWLIVTPDKGPSKEIYVKKGQRLTVPFADKVEIRLGNPSSVVFRYAGKETPVTTEKGESKTIRFP
ncbi:RodZ domain-containing protein [Solidesulfovibrio fructosivorans]|nr:RodZ domain-containing protein [Solidesulfovibrio fructosivorans]